MGRANRDDDRMHLDEIVDRWVEPWALCRESTCARVDGGWRVELSGSAHRTRETVLVEPGATTFSAYAEELVGHEQTWLSVVTRETRSWPLPTGTILQSASETLMTTALTRRRVDPRVRLSVTPTPVGAFADAEVVLQGRPAAVGTVGVLGTSAVVDRVRTYDAFQRRGLGTAVMSALTSWALEHGATTGVLVASAEGRPLYEHLGWQRVGAMATLRAA